MTASLKTLCRLATAFALTLFCAGAANAQAPTGTVTLNNVPTELTNAFTPHSVAVSYTLTAAAGSGINNAKITITVMPGFYVATIAGPAGVVGSCEYSQIPNAGMICTATLAISDGQGISGQLLLDGTRYSWSTQDGQSAPTTATLTANYNGGSMTPVVDTKYTLFHANAVPYIFLYPSGSEQWLVNPNTGEPGLAFEYYIQSYNQGNAAIFDPVISMTFPQPMLYLGWRATFNEGWYGTPNAPAQWANGQFSVAMTTDLNGTGSQIAVRLWIPCSALPLTTLSQPVTASLDGVEHKFAGDVARSATFENNQVPTTAATACGAGGGGGKSSTPYDSIGEGENFTFSVSATPPNGVVAVTDAVVVDRLPAKAVFVSAAAPVPTQFVPYFCVLPAVPGNFTAADFLSGPTYRTNGCNTTVPATPGTVTHLVWYAPTWGDAGGITNFSVTYTMNAPLDAFTNNEVLTNTARVQGSFNYNGAATFDMNATDTISVKTEALAQLVTQDYTPNPKQLGQIFRVQITNGSDQVAARIRNPVVTFDLPPGISFVPGNTTFDFGVNSGCGWLPGPAPVGVYPTAPVVSTLGNGYTRLSWTFGDANNPMRLPFNCFPEGWNNPLIIAFDLRIEPNAGLLNGQQLTVEHRLGGDNVTTPRLRETVMTIAVPAEMRTSVEPDCDAELEPSLLVNYQNSGGVELTNASVEVAIPKSTDGSGTEVDTTFVRTENVPPDATLEYYYSGAWSTSLPGDLALVQRVRLIENSSIPGLTPKRSFNVVLSVPNGTPIGTFIRGSSMMAAHPLGSLASANSAPIKVDMCPGIIGVHTFFDADGDGAYSAGDVNLAGWDFTVTDSFDAETILDWTTDAQGLYSQQLSPSTYEFEVMAPAPTDPQATWVFTTPSDTALESDDNITLPVAVTCTCNDDNGCTVDSCYLGVCTFEIGGEIPETDTTCDGIDDDCDGTDDDDFVPEADGCGSGPCAVEGTQVCQGGTIYFYYNGYTYEACQPDYGYQSQEVCDEQDNDCDGEVDNNLGLGEECTVGYGPCEATGVYVCSNQNVECNAVSEVQPETETCDNVDNDCDGGVDNGIAPEYTSCGIGGCATTGAMVCYQGTTVFMEGYRPGENDPRRVIEAIEFPTRCEPNDENRTAESCDNFDNDCDGYVDDGFHVGEWCNVGQGECFAWGQFQCGNGSSFCNAQEGTPQTERCDDFIDSDCDGRTDNGFELINQPCNATGGAEDADNCINDTYVCGGASLTCQSLTVAVERCDGLDNDCDGQADETFVGGFWRLGQACDGADGDACNEGVLVCNGAQNGTLCNDNSTTNVELCNGVDDDCDAATDENWKVGNDVGFTGVAGRFLGQTCDGSNDADLCERGTIECSLDFTTVYCHESGVALVELCDAAGADEDCDGVANEGFDIGVACMTDGVGACRVAGTIQCDDDNATSTCVATVAPEASAEVCNGIDDDCDGGIDNVPQSQTSICKPLETDITSGPPSITALTTATFTYVNPTATPVASHTTFQCSLDGGAWTPCNHVGASPSLVYASLPSGPHTLLVRAVLDGSVDPTPDVWTWVIDTSVPETTIVSAPSNPAQNPTGTIVFGSPTPGTFSCVVDPAGGTCPTPGAAAYSVCSNPYPYTNLAEGSHTICVYVTNTAGTVDPTPASHTWVIDLSAPETEIVATIPPKSTNETSVTFNYADPTAPATNTFECSLDGAAWVDCDGKTETYADLSEGEHTFTVRTVDNNGIVDPTPASYTFVVDLTAPCTTVTTRPADPSQSDAALFAFAAEVGSVFMCSLDGATAAACSAVTSLSGLSEGEHTLVVYSIDAAGNASSGQCRVTVGWTIDTRWPETEITASPTVLVGSGEEVTLTYIDPTDDDLLTFECSLDGAAFVRCDGTTAGEGGTTDYDGLPVGAHTFQVRSCDLSVVGAPQCDPTPATVTWEVTTSPCPNDRTAPALVCAADLVVECVEGGATIDLDDLDPAISDACAPVQSTTSASGEVSLGQTPVVFSGTDGNGNRSSCVTMVTVVDLTKPTAVCPADIEVGTDTGVCSAAVTIAAATGDDTCQGNVGLIHINDAPTTFIPGETIVTHHVIDAAGNEATCQQRVTVVDDEDLTLTCSDSATVDAPADACSWTGSRTALATDNCSDELTVDVTGTYPVGVSPVLFTAADAAGNSAECTTELTVRDVTKPVVVCGTPVGTLPTLITASATDACGATVTLQNVVCTKVVDGVTTNVPLADCPATINGASLEVDGRLVDGALAIAYEARAVDLAGNEHSTLCTYGNAADRDGDGIVDGDDNCVAVANTDQRDGDSDGVGDACDVCPTTNDDQADSDDNGVGDACQDKDRDGRLDIEDNCPDEANPGQEDADDDTLGDVCDSTPYDGITAEGAGGCAGGDAGLASVLGLLGLALVIGRRRFA